MRTGELKEYLGIVVDMEKNVFLQEHLLKDMVERMDRLGVSQTFTKPTQVMQPSKSNKMLEAILGTLLFPIYLWEEFDFDFMVFAIGITVGIVGYLFSISEVLGIIAVAVFIFLIFGYNLNEFEDNYQSRNKEWIKYEADLALYHSNIDLDAARVARENAEKEILALEIREIEGSLSISKKNLINIYEKDIIFPKYRNLIAVCSLYEYIFAGRCSSLEGHEGAYNIYEAEIRLDRIITQLDKVIVHLDAIRANQFMLYFAIQDMNQRSVLILESTQNMASQLHILGGQADSVLEQIAQLQKTSALTAYHAERTQKELSYMNRMDYFSGRNDDVFFNRPPV